MSFPDAIKTKIEFGDFKLTNKILGIGAFGAVQLAKHQKTNNYYALKIIDLSKFQGSVEQDFAKKEIMIHSKTNHKHIIKFYGTIKKNETLYHVLEYAENGNLYKMIKRNQKLTETQIFRFFFQTVLAVKYLHENDIIHRDIKVICKFYKPLKNNFMFIA